MGIPIPRKTVFMLTQDPDIAHLLWLAPPLTVIDRTCRAISHYKLLPVSLWMRSHWLHVNYISLIWGLFFIVLHTMMHGNKPLRPSTANQWPGNVIHIHLCLWYKWCGYVFIYVEVRIPLWMSPHCRQFNYSVIHWVGFTFSRNFPQNFINWYSLLPALGCMVGLWLLIVACVLKRYTRTCCVIINLILMIMVL